jgi:hypothetical protein
VSDEFVLDDETANSNNGGTLRQKLEQAIAALNELRKENESLKTEKATQVVNQTWDSLKVPAKFRSAYLGEKSPEAIRKWWEEISPLVNLEAAEGEPQPQELTPEQQVEQAAAQAFQQASGLGTDALSGGYDAAMAKAKEARGKTGADREAALKEFYASAQVPDFN